MKEHNERMLQLSARIDILEQKQYEFTREIVELREQLAVLKAAKWSTIASETAEKQIITPKETVEAQPIIVSETTSNIPKKIVEPEVLQPKVEAEIPTYTSQESNLEKSNLEKFIGENLLNKIGIIITVIGVSIGVKYSIEHELISPVMRIILGYLSGIGLLGFGIKLEKKYKNYSAVLVSGAIAIMYFITYAAHSFYGLIPQASAFVMMVIFTIFGVVTALRYNRQVIAHIGLVGAYAVPFLLSNDSGNAAVLFSYMTIINIGILVISYKKYWKALYGSSFGLTWLIYFSWYFSSYTTDRYFGVALLFLSIFFVIFYTIFLAYKVVKKEDYISIDVVLLLLNTFFFYAIGYAILDMHDTGENYLGVFTLLNALIHGVVAYVLFKQKDIDKNLLYLIIGFAIAFITISIPVELDGNWVTILWAFEAALLFWIGRTKNHAIYEKLSYALMLLAFLSIIQDWTTLYVSEYNYYTEIRLTPLLNMNFLSSVLFIAAFAFITKLYFKTAYTSPLKLSETNRQILSFIIPGVLVFVIYYAFRIEIENYWNQLHIDSGEINAAGDSYKSIQNLDYNLVRFKSLWVMNYTLFFLAVLSFVNIKKFKNELLGYINLCLNVIAIALFLTQGLYVLTQLRTSYMRGNMEVFTIGIRYISYLFVILLLVISYRYIREKFIKSNLKIIFDCVLHFTIVWLLSSELIHWFSLASNAASDKLGLSILWGSYALFTIVLGIWKKKTYLRIGAMALFGLTLIKLFLYDLVHLTTIAKTIVFVSLGVLLLIISFIYNKYKGKIFEEV